TGTTPPSIVLSATGRRSGTYFYIDLVWSGARGTSVDLYLNDRFRRTSTNNGRTTLTISSPTATSYRVKVCETGSTVCSNVATVDVAVATASGAAP
ncbi:MAG TPA: chitinase N-terminal domain-containing protein, partial [Gemmatimonadales bacterium]|nr:chitinase N-terminal domain-containing protein [Gemmatimonadales bacterium]